MNKLLILLFSIFFTSCCNEAKRLNNGLTKKATKITEYTIDVEKDSSNNIVQDTMSMTEKQYNAHDQIVKRIQKTFFDNEKLEIDHIYDDSNKIKKERVIISTENLPFAVDYEYKDSLLHQSKGYIENNNEKFEQIETYYYRTNKTKEKTVATQIFIDLKAADTIRSSVSSFFDENELVQRSETVHNNDPERNIKTKYEYDCGTLVGLREYDRKDSLLYILKYEYELDEFDNWTKKRIIKNDNLDGIVTREILYK